MTDQLRPMPTIDADAAPYWEGTRNHELRIQRCKSCRAHRFYPRLLCPVCWSDECSWVVASGTGTLYSVSVVHRAPFPALRAEAPYSVALVDLDEGVRMFAALTGDPVNHRIGARVKVEFRKISDEITLPMFSVDAATIADIESAGIE